MSSASSKPRRRFARDVGGATAAEFAMVLPILCMMMLGLFEFGWTQHCLSSARFALENASRQLMLNPDLTESQLEAIVQAQLTGKADPEVEVSLDIDETDAGRIAELTAEYTRGFEPPFLPAFEIDYDVSVETALPPA